MHPLSLPYSLEVLVVGRRHDLVVMNLGPAEQQVIAGLRVDELEWEASSVVIIKNDSIVVKPASAPRPPFDQLAALYRVSELDNRFRYGQSLLWTEIHLVVEVLEFV